MSAQTTHIRLAGATIVLIGFATVTSGCSDFINRPSVSPSSRSDPAELFAVKYRIFEDLKRGTNGSLKECPVVFGADRLDDGVPTALTNQYGSSDQYVSLRITRLTEPDFYQIELASPQDKMARLTVKGEGTVTLNGNKYERQPINVTYFLAENRGFWHCMHAHASLDPRAVIPNRVGW